MGVGDLTEIEDSLRQARRLLYVTATDGDPFRFRNLIPSTPGLSPRRFIALGGGYKGTMSWQLSGLPKWLAKKQCLL